MYVQTLKQVLNSPTEKHDPVLTELNIEGVVKKLAEIRASNESKDKKVVIFAYKCLYCGKVMIIIVFFRKRCGGYDRSWDLHRWVNRVCD